MKRVKYIYLIIVCFSLATILLSVYYFLGGFEKVEVFAMKTDSKVAVGRHFTGRQTDPLIQQYFEEARTLVTTKKIRGELTLIEFKNDTIPKNRIHYFLGVIIDGDMAEIPSGYRVLTLTGRGKLAVFLSMSPFVRPSPARIEKLFQARANELNIHLQPLILEVHYPDNSMRVESWY